MDGQKPGRVLASSSPGLLVQRRTEMDKVVMKLSEMKKSDTNVRLHTENQLREYERSVRKFGQIRPIIVDENNVILVGNGLYEAMIRAGKTEADVYKITDLSENDKKKLMLSDNKIYSLGVDDFGNIDAILKSLGDDLDIPGYDEEVLQQMAADADDITGKVSGYGMMDNQEIESIKKTEMKPVRQEPEQPQEGQDTKNGEISGQEGGDGSTAAEATGDGPAFVICPNCGEKIWLS